MTLYTQVNPGKSADLLVRRLDDLMKGGLNIDQ